MAKFMADGGSHFLSRVVGDPWNAGIFCFPGEGVFIVTSQQESVPILHHE